MKTTTYYRMTYVYNAGLLGADIKRNTLEEIRGCAEEYKAMEDCDKFYRIDEVTITKKRFKKEEITIKTIESWFEE